MSTRNETATETRRESQSDLPPVVAEYVRSTNAHEPAAFHALFAEDAVVNDAGREMRGRAAIEAWSNKDIFEANVTIEVLAATESSGATTITTKVDGNFDRTGLPDPVLIDHRIVVQDDKIARLTCRLTESLS